MIAKSESPIVTQGDISPAWVEDAQRAGIVGCDIETTGLDWRVDRIETFQIAIEDRIAVVKLDGSTVPEHVCQLISDPDVRKVFHHAPFDLRFMSSAWAVVANNVACTKIAAKIVSPAGDARAYSLKPVLRKYLGVDIDKEQQLSDWSLDALTDAQVAYAADDVRHLVKLLGVLEGVAEERGVATLVRSAFGFLPSRVALDLMGAGDVYEY